MEKNVITVTKDTPYEEVAKILYEHNISGVPVLDEGEKIVGIVSEKDIYRVLYPYYKSYYEHPESYTDLEERECKASEIKDHRAEVFMSKNVVPIKPEDPVMLAGSIMLAKNISRLPVVESGKVVGIISRKMIYRAILKRCFDFK